MFLFSFPVVFFNPNPILLIALSPFNESYLSLPTMARLFVYSNEQFYKNPIEIPVELD